MTDIKDTERLGKTSASSFSDDFACLGRRNFINSLPPGIEAAKDDSADYGNAVHLAIETQNPMPLDEEQYSTYIAIMAQEEVIVRTWLQENGIDACNPPAVEQRLWINGDDLEPLTSAKLDRYWRAGRNALIVDVKSLYAPRLPRAKDSWQLKIQAVCLWLETDCNQIRVAYNCPNKFGRKFDTADFNLEDLRSFLDQIKHIVGLMNKPDAPRSPGDQCRYCVGKAYCPEALSMSLLPTVIAQASRDLSKEEIQSKVALLGLPDRVFLWQRASVINNIIDAVKASLKREDEATLNEYGIRLSPGKDTSYVPGDKIKVMAEALVAAGLPQDEVWQCLSLDTAALNELALKVKGGTKKAATEWAKAQVLPFKTESTGEKILREI